MKKITTTLLAALMLLAIYCTKENSVKSSTTTDEISTRAVTSDADEPAGSEAVRIGTQVWKIKDLTTSFYRNGDRILQVQDPKKWKHLTKGAWCWYNNNPDSGKLYNWYAVNDPRGLAPEGWHIPSNAEWETLVAFLGGEDRAGAKMKSTGTIEAGTGLWHGPNAYATNHSGFTGLPGGYRDTYSYHSYSTFRSIGYYGYWWTSSEFSPNTASIWALSYEYSNAIGNSNSKQDGLSVRCLRD